MIGDLPLREELRHFGFSDKEIDTYVALLRLGESKAANIAADADVSKRYIYDVMNRFENRNFVSINNHKKPTTIEPHKPADVIEQLDKRLSSLRSNLEATYTENEKRDDYGFKVIRSERTVRKRLSTLIQNSEKELILSVPCKYIKGIRLDLRKAVDDGVFVLLLINTISDRENLKDPKGIGNVVRIWDKPSPLVLIADDQHGLYRSSNPVNQNSNGDTSAVIHSDGYLNTMLYRTFFTGGWTVAKEAHIAPPLTLPQSYDSFIHSLFDAMMYYRRGKTVIADLSIRETGTHGPFENRSVEIVDIKQGIIKPESSTIPIQSSLVVNSNGDTFTVSDIGGFLEDYEARSVKLMLKDESD